MPEKTILNKIDGHEFEELMADVFRKMGYNEVSVTEKAGDMGRDIKMKEAGEKVIVECKHMAQVGRPVAQKFHSAISTFENCKRGIIATSGSFTNEAREYISSINKNGAEDIELIGGKELRDISDEIGLDLYNGKIEVVCDEVITYPDNQEVIKQVKQALEELNNFDFSYFDPSKIFVKAQLRPVLRSEVEVQSIFETSVGVVSHINTQDNLYIWAGQSNVDLMAKPFATHLRSNIGYRESLDEKAINSEFTEIDKNRFAKTETDFKEDIIDVEIKRHTHSVSYTGRNNVTYDKLCEPSKSDITVKNMLSFYLPQIGIDTPLGEYKYRYSFYSGNNFLITKNEFNQCVHCKDKQPILNSDGMLFQILDYITLGLDFMQTELFKMFSFGDTAKTFCQNCGSINCRQHIKTERLRQEPVCVGCAMTDRFFLSKKYFFNQENWEDFTDHYQQLPFYKKALKNPILLSFLAIVLLILLAFLV